MSTHDPTLRVLEFLDTAYRVTEGHLSYEDMFAAAGTLFFLSPDGTRPDDRLHELPLDAAIGQHVERLSQGIARLSQLGPEGLANLLIDPESETIVEGNKAAEALIGATFPAPLSALGGDAHLRRALGRLRDPDARSDVTELIINRPDDGQKLLARLCSVDGGRKALLTLAFFQWTADRVAPMARKFSLTDSEASVLTGLLNGKSQSRIADERGRSVETIRAQAKAVLKKTGCARATELVPLALGLALLDAPAGDGLRWSEARPAEDRLISPMPRTGAASGRTLGVLEAGLPSGRPVLLVHGLLYGPFLSPEMGRELARAGLRLVGPSRPGFGLTDPPETRAGYERATVRDAMEVLKDVSRPVVVLACQAGASHACRIAAALGDRARALVLVAPGIPIRDRHLEQMPQLIRVATAAGRHAPRVLDLLIRMSIPTWQRRGSLAYYRRLLARSPSDLAALDDPETGGPIAAGLGHVAAQGAQAFVNDGLSTVSDWTADYRDVPCDVHWFVGSENSAFSVEDMRRFATAEGCASFDVADPAGSTLLFTHFSRIVASIAEIGAG